MRRTDTCDRVLRLAEQVGHRVLDLGRVLGCAEDQHVAALLRDRQRDLGFQVEMVLAADVKLAFEHDRCRRQFGLGIAAPHLDRRAQPNGCGA